MYSLTRGTGHAHGRRGPNEKEILFVRLICLHWGTARLRSRCVNTVAARAEPRMS